MLGRICGSTACRAVCVVALTLLLATAGWSASRSLGAAAMHGTTAASARVVLSPRPGQRVRAYPFTVRVRAAGDLPDLRAWLNGRAIGPDFAEARRGVRSLEVSVSQGLR